jgi:hypothetical protein
MRKYNFRAYRNKEVEKQMKSPYLRTGLEELEAVRKTDEELARSHSHGISQHLFIVAGLEKRPDENPKANVASEFLSMASTDAIAICHLIQKKLLCLHVM